MHYTVIYLFKEYGDLLHQFRTVPFHRLAPDKGVFIGLGLYLRAVNIFRVKRDESLFP